MDNKEYTPEQHNKIDAATIIDYIDKQQQDEMPTPEMLRRIRKLALSIHSRNS